MPKRQLRTGTRQSFTNSRFETTRFFSSLMAYQTTIHRRLQKNGRAGFDSAIIANNHRQGVGRTISSRSGSARKKRFEKGPRGFSTFQGKEGYPAQAKRTGKKGESSTFTLLSPSLPNLRESNCCRDWETAPCRPVPCTFPLWLNRHRRRSAASVARPDVQSHWLLNRSAGVVVMVRFLFPAKKLWATVITRLLALPLSLIGDVRNSMYPCRIQPRQSLVDGADHLATGFVVEPEFPVMIPDEHRALHRRPAMRRVGKAALTRRGANGFTVVSLSISARRGFHSASLLFMDWNRRPLVSRHSRFTMSVAVGGSAFVSLTLTPHDVREAVALEKEEEREHQRWSSIAGTEGLLDAGFFRNFV